MGDDQCTGTDNAHCYSDGSNEQPSCRCIKGYVDINSTCFKGIWKFTRFIYLYLVYVNSRNNKLQQETDKEILYEVWFKNITSLAYIGSRRLYESCDWSEQCNGTHKANQCRYVGTDKICYCQDGYISFNDMCLKSN